MTNVRFIYQNNKYIYQQLSSFIIRHYPYIKVNNKLKGIAIIFVFFIHATIIAQSDSLPSKLSFNADFRFRIEQDWHSKKSDGTFYDDRTRFRYRLRAGVVYEEEWYSAGFRIRTGDPRKQQDSQLTLGDGFKNFGTLPIGLEQAYFQGKWRTFKFWIGKNSFPFEKNNELFWSENVYPEGIFLKKTFLINSDFINSIDLRGGHFIMASSGKSLDMDSYFQAYQAHIKFSDNRFQLFPAVYLFKNIPNIPDGYETFKIDYSILHFGSKIQLTKKPLIDLEFDYYKNMQRYNQIDSIPKSLKEQKSGFVVALKYGSLAQKGDWLFKLSYANLQKYSAVDFMAQNDWARWDYASVGSPDGRLTNFRGLEVVAGFKLSKKVNIKMKYYFVEQLIPYGTSKETGNRIRLDLDFKF